MAHRYVVMAIRVVGFDTSKCALGERRSYEGASVLVEVARHDYLYDEARDEWRVMLG